MTRFFAWFLVIFAIQSPPNHEEVTTVAVKLRAMGMFTLDHMGSTFAGFDEGMAPAN